MKEEIKSLHEKIDQLLLVTKASSFEAYSKAAVESIIKRVMKEHVANDMTMSKAVSDSADVCKTTTGKVDKLITETIEFMNDYKTTYNSNTASANHAIQNVGVLLKTEKANFVQLLKDFKTDQEAFHSSILEKITKLQEDLAMERKIMDALALKEEK